MCSSLVFQMSHWSFSLNIFIVYLLKDWWCTFWASRCWILCTKYSFETFLLRGKFLCVCFFWWVVH